MFNIWCYQSLMFNFNIGKAVQTEFLSNVSGLAKLHCVFAIWPKDCGGEMNFYFFLIQQRDFIFGHLSINLLSDI